MVAFVSACPRTTAPGGRAGRFADVGRRRARSPASSRAPRIAGARRRSPGRADEPRPCVRRARRPRARADSRPATTGSPSRARRRGRGDRRLGGLRARPQPARGARTPRAGARRRVPRSLDPSAPVGRRPGPSGTPRPARNRPACARDCARHRAVRRRAGRAGARRGWVRARRASRGARGVRARRRRLSARRALRRDDDAAPRASEGEVPARSPRPLCVRPWRRGRSGERRLAAPRRRARGSLEARARARLRGARARPPGAAKDAQCRRSRECSSPSDFTLPERVEAARALARFGEAGPPASRTRSTRLVPDGDRNGPRQRRARRRRVGVLIALLGARRRAAKRSERRSARSPASPRSGRRRRDGPRARGLAELRCGAELARGGA